MDMRKEKAKGPEEKAEERGPLPIVIQSDFLDESEWMSLPRLDTRKEKRKERKKERRKAERKEKAEAKRKAEEKRKEAEEFRKELTTGLLSREIKESMGPLPRVLQGKFKVVDDYVTFIVGGNAYEIANLFPCLWGQQSSRVVASKKPSNLNICMNIGVLPLGDQEIGCHNIIRGIMDYIQTPGHAKAGVTVYTFLEGLDGLCNGNWLILDYALYRKHVLPYGFKNRNYMNKIETQSKLQEAVCAVIELELDALVVIGGEEANTTACILAENFKSKKMKTRVIGCPNKCNLKVKTIDGDLDCNQVIGFDAACKTYAEVIENVMIDARSTGEYYHFVSITGREVSRITLECALQTHPNIALIAEEVIAKKLTLKNIRDQIVDVICKRSEMGYNYGVILIPEGLFDIIPEVQKLMAELCEIWKCEVPIWHPNWWECDDWKRNLSKQCEELFDFLPLIIQKQVVCKSNPMEYSTFDMFETDWLLLQLVEIELEKRKKEGLYKGDFKSQTHFLGCKHAIEFDLKYGYALGHAVAALIQNSVKTGLIASLGNLDAPVEEWTVGAIPLTCLMDVERRHDGTLKPVIKKQAMVELDGAPFNTFASMRDEWALRK